MGIVVYKGEDIVMVFQDRLKQVMDEKNFTQADLARATGISTGAISKYLSDPNKEPSGPYMLKLAKALDVSSEWLYGITDVRKPFYEPPIVDTYERLSEIGKKEVYDFALFLLQKETVEKEEAATTYEFPLLGKTAAGAGVSVGDPSYETITIHNIPKGADYALAVKGNSMEPLIKDRSVVFVRQQPIVENGEIAIIDIDGEITCKKFYQENGEIELRSINPEYDHIRPVPIKTRVIGKVVFGEE
jgi:repressor LexA